MASSMLRMIAAGVVSPDCSSTTRAIGAKQASKGRVSSSATRSRQARPDSASTTAIGISGTLAGRRNEGPVCG
jgi:hypothetical protein